MAFFGLPSRTGEFTVQYGGHHAAYNITSPAGTSLSP
ncbi:hypothetical protein ACRAWF_25360 [Streptomyces sp. L7]